MAGWKGSTRRETLPPDWATRIRPAVLDRDDQRCTWLHRHSDNDGGFADYLAGNYRPTRRCAAPARDVDHWGPRHDHRVEMCRALCGAHHDRRSGKQGGQASVASRRRMAQQRIRPTAPHPGLRETP